MEYCSLVDLKKVLSIPETDTSQDVRLTDLITTLTSLVDLELGWNLGEKEITRRVSGMGSNRLLLEGPINGVLEVKQFTNISSGEFNNVGIDFFEGAIVYLDKVIPKGNKNVEIIYKRGFTSVPVDVKTFFLKYCTEMNSIQLNGEDTVKNKKIEGLSITYFSPSELLDGKKMNSLSDFSSILKKYKIFNSIHY
ncbi:hypothetical protein GW846_03185 [Candidatus Gracilibacteria bacterium]|nr:hypothetical protein [Candidatus Gracilibacteria bacterium]